LTFTWVANGGLMIASRNLPTKKERLDKARCIGNAKAGYVDGGSVIGRSSRKWQPEGDVHRAAE